MGFTAAGGVDGEAGGLAGVGVGDATAATPNDRVSALWDANAVEIENVRAAASEMRARFFFIWIYKSSSDSLEQRALRSSHHGRVQLDAANLWEV